MADEEKKRRSSITAFYQGGTKFHADCVLDRVGVEAEMIAARKESRDAKLETFEVDANKNMIEEKSFLYVSRNALLFYNIVEVKEELTSSLIELDTSIKRIR